MGRTYKKCWVGFRWDESRLETKYKYAECGCSLCRNETYFKRYPVKQERKRNKQNLRSIIYELV